MSKNQAKHAEGFEPRTCACGEHVSERPMWSSAGEQCMRCSRKQASTTRRRRTLRRHRRQAVMPAAAARVVTTEPGDRTLERLKNATMLCECGAAAGIQATTEQWLAVADAMERVASA